MASQVEIWNMALMRIGHSETVESPTESSTAARACRVFWDTTLDSVLRTVAWPFATKRVSLSLLAEDPPQNWGYVYAVPSDCLAIRSITSPGSRVTRVEDRIPFEANGSKLFTDIPQAELVYTARISDTARFDPLFISALTWALASELGMALAVKPDLAQMAQRAYQMALREAIAASFSEGHDNPPACSFLSVRD